MQFWCDVFRRKARQLLLSDSASSSSSWLSSVFTALWTNPEGDNQNVGETGEGKRGSPECESPCMLRVPYVTEWKTWFISPQSEGICVYPCESLTVSDSNLEINVWLSSHMWSLVNMGILHIPRNAFHVGLLCMFLHHRITCDLGLSQECGLLPSPAAAFFPFISSLSGWTSRTPELS